MRRCFVLNVREHETQGHSFPTCCRFSYMMVSVDDPEADEIAGVSLWLSVIYDHSLRLLIDAVAVVRTPSVDEARLRESLEVGVRRTPATEESSTSLDPGSKTAISVLQVSEAPSEASGVTMTSFPPELEIDSRSNSESRSVILVSVTDTFEHKPAPEKDFVKHWLCWCVIRLSESPLWTIA